MLKKRKNLIVDLVIAAAIIGLIMPFANAILYSLPSTDDFAMAMHASSKGPIFISALYTAYDFYMNWAGGWIGAFLEVILNPLVYFGTTSPMYGVEMLLFFVGFIGVLLGTAYSFTKRVLKDKSFTTALLLVFVFLLWLLNIDAWTEIFHWFVGSSYLWGVMFTLWTLHFEMKYFEGYKKEDAIKLSIVGFVTGTFYSTAVVPCFIYLIYAILLFVKKEEKIVKKLVPFGFMLAGAFMAIFAPGNFTRKSSEGGGLQIFAAFEDTMVVWKQLMSEILKSPLFILVAIMFVAIGIKTFPKEKLVLGNPVIPFILSGICVYINYYPLALGYGSSTYLPNRAKFIFSVFVVLLFALSFLYLGGWIAEKFPAFIELKTSRQVARCVACIIAFAYLSFVPAGRYGELAWFKVRYRTPEMKALNQRCTDLLDQIEESDEKDYVWHGPYIEDVIIKQPGFFNNDNGGVNAQLVKYMNKNSITVIWE